jgi:hypothetical protein
MSTTPGWRQLYDRLEKSAVPVVEQVVHSEEFAQATALITSVQRGLRDRVNQVAARGWHTINLPAGSDVQRLRRQVGALDREVRLLTLELRRLTREEVRRDGVDDA